MIAVSSCVPYLDPRHLVDPFGREIFRVKSEDDGFQRFVPGLRWYRINGQEVTEDEFHRRLANAIEAERSERFVCGADEFEITPPAGPDGERA